MFPASSEIVSFTNILQSFQRDKYWGSLPLNSETRNLLYTEQIIIDLHKYVFEIVVFTLDHIVLGNQDSLKLSYENQ